MRLIKRYTKLNFSKKYIDESSNVKTDMRNQF